MVTVDLFHFQDNYRIFYKQLNSKYLELYISRQIPTRSLSCHSYCVNISNYNVRKKIILILIAPPYQFDESIIHI